MTSTSPPPVAARPKRIFPKTTGLTALWRHRQSLTVLVRRDLAVKYQATVMGYLWSLIEPLGLAFIYWFIFGVLYDRGGLPAEVEYPLYIVSGIFAWQWMSSAMTEATTSLTSQASLITTMRVPREVFPVARVFARFAEFLAGIPILLAFVYFFDGQIGWHTFNLFFAVAMHFMILTGLSFILASINVLFRDVQRFMRLVMRVLFYGMPIIYPLEKVVGPDSPLDSWVQTAYQVNPFVGIMQLYRSAWIPQIVPSTFQILVSVGFCVFLLFFGRWLFYKLEPAVLKEI
ncbi:ABC-2 type transport system permease protein [Stackebrandtia albiflava]|uniref:Transport permease protein n=1 Tax=Stackebrandtia albiflava TaxID=406432 RepID=A0A562V310_9ACTN|nr:ABC transporter permease [Stackebrandtia albiflava]TWJ12289.1 ABC-2 type transport system permease protein [Stackebrandtia albiflava]